MRGSRVCVFGPRIGLTVDHSLDAELQEDTSDMTATLREALRSRQHLLTADLEDVGEKFKSDIS